MTCVPRSRPLAAIAAATLAATLLSGCSVLGLYSGATIDHYRGRRPVEALEALPPGSRVTLRLVHEVAISGEFVGLRRGLAGADVRDAAGRPIAPPGEVAVRVGRDTVTVKIEAIERIAVPAVAAKLTLTGLGIIADTATILVFLSNWGVKKLR